jgi:hypothetical protein
MNLKAFALGFALVLPLTVVGVADAAPRSATGALSVDGTTATASYVGVKKSDTVRLQALCQVANTGVVWSQVQTLTQSPTTVTYSVDYDDAYGPITNCRVDLFVVSGGNKITYLEWKPL